MLTKFERRALEILARLDRPISAGRFAKLCWHDSPSWHRYCNVGHGSALGVGIKQQAGRCLHRLHRKGLVYEEWTSGYYSVWSISSKGREELNRID